MAIHFFEHYKRSLAKTVTFRILALSVDFLIVHSITKRVDLALGVVITVNLSSTILYFIHERIWNTIHWGKKK